MATSFFWGIGDTVSLKTLYESEKDPLANCEDIIIISRVDTFSHYKTTFYVWSTDCC